MPSVWRSWHNANIVNVSTVSRELKEHMEMEASVLEKRKTHWPTWKSVGCVCGSFFGFFLFVFLNWSDNTTKQIIYSSSDDMLDLNVADGLWKVPSGNISKWKTATWCEIWNIVFSFCFFWEQTTTTWTTTAFLQGHWNVQAFAYSVVSYRFVSLCIVHLIFEYNLDI